MTLRQKFESIKDIELREKVLRNASAELDLVGSIDYTNVDFSTLISCTFRWDETPEGYDYWESVYYLVTEDGCLY